MNEEPVDFEAKYYRLLHILKNHAVFLKREDFKTHEGKVGARLFIKAVNEEIKKATKGK